MNDKIGTYGSKRYPVLSCNQFQIERNSFMLYFGIVDFGQSTSAVLSVVTSSIGNNIPNFGTRRFRLLVKYGKHHCPFPSF